MRWSRTIKDTKSIVAEIKEPVSNSTSVEPQEDADTQPVSEQPEEEQITPEDTSPSPDTDPEGNEQETVPSEEVIPEEDEPQFRVLSTISKLLLVRSMLFFVVLLAILNARFQEPVCFLGSLGLVFCAIGGGVLLVRFNNTASVLEKYIVVSSAIVDIGVLFLVVFLNEVSSAYLFLLFPVLTIFYGLISNLYQMIGIAGASMLFHLLAYTAFNYRVATPKQYLVAIVLHCTAFGWGVVFQTLLRAVNKNTFLKYHVFAIFTHILDRLPATIAKKLACLLQFQKIDSLEYEFRKKYEELVEIINEKTVEIEKLQSRIESGGSADDEFEQDVSNAVMEINNLMEIENMTLRDENEKLSEMVKGYDDRIDALTQETETLNLELERTYRDKEKQGSSSANKNQTENVVDATVS